MPAKFIQLQVHCRIWLLGLLVALTATACAPDMFHVGRSNQLDAFLNRVAKNCGSQTIHGIEVWQLADDDGSLAGQEDFFIDQASMLLYGTITPEQYMADLSGYFEDDSPQGKRAYQCIIAQLPTNDPKLPNAYRDVMKAAPQVSGND